jgi:hypothetical protein
MSFAKARAAARSLFPNWSRTMRARWVLARLKVDGPRVAVSSGWPHDRGAYYYERVGR